MLLQRGTGDTYQIHYFCFWFLFTGASNLLAREFKKRGSYVFQWIPLFSLISEMTSSLMLNCSYHSGSADLLEMPKNVTVLYENKKKSFKITVTLTHPHNLTIKYLQLNFLQKATNATVLVLKKTLACPNSPRTGRIIWPFIFIFNPNFRIYWPFLVCFFLTFL